jgi:tetratricopeptide (TPR) repeat protein
MKAFRLLGRGVAMGPALLAATLHAAMASAQEESHAASEPPDASHMNEASSGDAGKHFRHGVQLYGEADYAAALVEFKRAYSIAPSSATLYNVGETQFQLQDYAGALRTFRRFLGEFGPNESHRAEIERNVEILRTRVGHVSVTTTPSGADITLDDQPVGKTPLAEPLLVSVGHRKLVASMAGRSPVTWYVDVAADDEVSVTMQLPLLPGAASAGATSARSPSDRSATQTHDPTLRIAGFVATGVLAAGAVTFGVLAVDEARVLRNARNTFPAVGATINHDANLTMTYSVLADSLAAAAIIVGGITLYGTLSSTSTNGASRGSGAARRVTLGPGSARFEMTF